MKLKIATCTYISQMKSPLFDALYTGSTDLCWEKLKFETIFSKFKNYLKNHCTNTWHVCTHFNAFFMLSPNMAMTKWQISKNFEKAGNFGLSSALYIWEENVNKGQAATIFSF